MKSVNFLLIALALPSISAMAANTPIWSCTDRASIEGAGISEDHGKFWGDVSWDCFPGDGVCNQDAMVV